MRLYCRHGLAFNKTESESLISKSESGYNELQSEFGLGKIEEVNPLPNQP